MTVSVAMAAYNGSRYIKEQIDSILPQLCDDDELVISLDPSDDETEKIIYGFNDKRIKLVMGKGLGLKKNFENAIENCVNDIIFLCDQDDVWLNDKVEKVKREFATKQTVLVMHNAQITDAELNVTGESFFAVRDTKVGIAKNIIKNSYIGCCMAFKRELLQFILPFPENIPMHDQWIGLTAERHGGVALINEPLILYRRHGDNVSSDSHAGIAQMIKWRLSIIKNLFGDGRRDGK